MKLAAITLAIGTMFSANLSANAAELFERGDWSLGGSLSYFNLDTEQAAKLGISENAFSVGVKVNYLQESWLTTLSGQALIYNDKNSFREDVEGTGIFNNGDFDIKSSDASGAIFSIATGGYWRFGDKGSLSFLTQVGLSSVVASERSIAECSNCRSEDIDLDGGAFVKVAVAKKLESVNIGLQATQYVSGDGLKNSIGVTLSTTF